jgi:retron-type reverse transcriptase
MVKRYGNLFPSMITFENLYRAYRKAAKGKRGQPNVAAFEFHLEDNLFQLQEELATGSYCPGPYTSFYIYDPKHRLISAAPFRDRVVHHALCNVIEPIFECTFIGDAYANRKGKGTHAALDRAQTYARHDRYVLQCDVVQFFPSIDHAILRDILARKLDDARVMALIDRILASGVGVLSHDYDLVTFSGDDLFAALRPRGLPIGNLTSQFWGNVYLNALDQYVKRTLHCKAYLRYVDDFLLFSDSKPQLWTWKRAIQEKLAGLRLILHERSSTVYPVTNGIPFLGFRLYPTHRRLKRRNGAAFARRYRAWRRAVAQGHMSLEDLHVRLQGWIAHAEHGDTYGLRRSLLSEPIIGVDNR